MAVSQGISLDNESAVATEPLVVEGLLERRPCVALCAILPPSLSVSECSHLRQSLSVFALANDGLLLMRKEHAVELIFGIQACSEFDVYKAYVAAYKVYETLQKSSADCGALQAAISAGMAIVSMKRHGGCTGDVIASPAIGSARALAEHALPGTLQMDSLAMALLQLAQPGSISSKTTLLISDLVRMPWQHCGELPPMYGRDSEWAPFEARLQGLPTGQKSLLAIQGETGMGKSLFCLHLARSAKLKGASVIHLMCLSRHLGQRVYTYPHGEPMDIESLPTALRREDANSPRWVIMDDCQHLRSDILDALIRLSFSDKNSVFLFAGRRLGHALQTHADIVKLGRLSDQAIRQLATCHGLDEERIQRITQKAQGVPLFAQLLALHKQRLESLPFPLYAVISARIDGLKLDHRLLALLASSPEEGHPLEKIARQLNESVEAVKSALDKTVASGVLYEADNRYFFNHPLLRQAVVESIVE
ncbi:MAG: ATP-binding protein, partial [Methylomonas sp.]|nr:ATP-binding protein [Methylomonas sp.]